MVGRDLCIGGVFRVRHGLRRDQVPSANSNSGSRCFHRSRGIGCGDQTPGQDRRQIPIGAQSDGADRPDGRGGKGASKPEAFAGVARWAENLKTLKSLNNRSNPRWPRFSTIAGPQCFASKANGRFTVRSIAFRVQGPVKRLRKRSQTGTRIWRR